MTYAKLANSQVRSVYTTSLGAGVSSRKKGKGFYPSFKGNAQIFNAFCMEVDFLCFETAPKCTYAHATFNFSGVLYPKFSIHAENRQYSVLKMIILLLPSLCIETYEVRFMLNSRVAIGLLVYCNILPKTARHDKKMSALLAFLINLRISMSIRFCLAQCVVSSAHRPHVQW